MLNDARCKKAEDVGRVVFPADSQAPLLLQPGKKSFDEPAMVIAPQGAASLGLAFADGPVRRN